MQQDASQGGAGDVARPSSSPGARRLLVVAGPGRSGTSLFTGLASRLGVQVPQPEVGADTTNPKGFSEPRWAVEFHTRLLSSVAVTSDDGRERAWNLTAKVAERPRARADLSAWLETQFATSDRVVVKDPRLGWFLELYGRVCSELGIDLQVATMLRAPSEVLKSRELAYGTRSTNATRMTGWLNMMFALERLTRTHKRAILSYDDLLADWHSALGTADTQLQMDLLTRASEAQIKEADALVDPTLRRSQAEWADLGLPERLQGLAQQTYDTMGSLVGCALSEQSAAQERLDSLRAEFRDYYEESTDVARSVVTAARADERRKVLAELESGGSASRSVAGGGSVRSRLRASAGRLRRLPGRQLHRGRS